MKTLKDLLQKVAVLDIKGEANVPLKALQINSKKVQPGDCFVALRGTQSDGHVFISDAIAQGALAIVCELLPSQINEKVTYVQVANSASALGLMAGAFYDHPSEKMKVIGVTGTNGKTSTVTLLFRLFRKFSLNAGLLSTVQNQINEEIIDSTHTTPDAIAINALMKKMLEAGCQYCFMEVSSHAVEQQRIAGLHFSGAVFTNITHDHLDYHKTFENYLKAKKKFFDDLPSGAFAVTNADDRNGNVMLQNTTAGKFTYSLKNPSDYKCKVIENSIAGLQLLLDGTEMHTRLIGNFNAYNLTAVYAVARLLQLPKIDVLTTLSALAPPPGRFEQVVSAHEKIVGIVDYAHTPDALKNVLQTIKAIANGNEKVITVTGCGGDRDAAKRPLMAQISCKFSDYILLTSDNPRSEDPNEILRQMMEGVPVTDKRKVLVIADRREAIKTAVTLAGPNDIILLAGKGHEKYQEVNGVKNHFDDKEELQKCFEELQK